MFIRSFAAAALVFTAGAACAQNYPTKPIHLITAGVGGGNDMVSRILAAGITGPLGQSVVVENRGGLISGAELAKAPADGYTIMLQGASIWLAPFLYDTVPFDPVKDFAPITIADKSPNLIIVHPSLPVNSVKELIALAKAKPGTINWSSGNNGSANHIAGEYFRSLTGTDMVRVPYKSAAQEATDLLAGRVQMTFASTGKAMVHVKSGKLRALAVASAQRSPLAPGVPSAADAGLPGFEVDSIQAVFARAGTPTAIINRLNQEMVRYLRLPDAREKLLANDVEAVGSTPEELAAVVKSEMGRLGKVIKDANIRAE